METLLVVVLFVSIRGGEAALTLLPKPLSFRFFTLLMLVAAASAQSPYRIEGTVTAQGSELPLQGVEVLLYPDALIDRGNEIALQTDARGHFQYSPAKPGLFSIWVAKQGWESSSLGNATSDRATVTLTEAAPSNVVRFSLHQKGDIEGRLIDADTSQPIADYQVGIAQYRRRNGKPSAASIPLSVGADGGFRTRVVPGDYLVEILPRTSAASRVATQFTADDARKIDLDYRRQFFPGGPSIETALPFNVPGGGLFPLGTIRLKKEPLYRVHVKVDPRSCPPGAVLYGVEVEVQTRAGAGVPRGPCQSFLLTHVAPGSYELRLMLDLGPDAGHSALLRYQVTEENVDLNVVFEPDEPVPGAIVMEEQQVAFNRFNIRFNPQGAVMVPQKVDERGNFTIPRVQRGTNTVVIDGLNEEYFIKEISYRGQTIHGPTFDYDGPGALAVRIAKSPAAVSGVVVSGDRPVGEAEVIFVRWPSDGRDDPGAVQRRTAGSDGRFAIRGMAPGEYKVFAVRLEDREKAERPAPWKRLTAQAQTVKFGPGSAPDLRIDVSDPSR